jgi:hypothetical protein
LKAKRKKLNGKTIDMGLSFHYYGSLKKGASVTDLIEEVKDIAEILNWQYDILDTDFPEEELMDGKVDGNLYGICFSPEKCEPVFLTFLSNRRLCSPINLDEFEKPVALVPESAYWIFTKTQYAGPEAHMAVIHVLKHISQKYLEEITVTDEGEYWETGDENLLRDTFRRYTALIDGFAAAFGSEPVKPGEIIEDYIKRIIELLKIKGI